MNTEDQIAELLAEAEPLRILEDDDPLKVPLTKIVDKINALRAIQANEVPVVIEPMIEGADAKADEPDEPIKRGPGRPKGS